jgi:hypothetical protein
MDFNFNELDKNIIEESPVMDFKGVFKKSIIDLNTKPAMSPLVVSIGYDNVAYNGVYYPLRFGTAGNISMIMGEEKSRKTWLKSLILACIQGGNSNTYSSEIVGHNLQNKYIIDLDTEQGAYDNWMVASRVPKMVGYIPENYLALGLREKTPNERSQLIEWLFMESEYKDKLGLVCIDGFVDCINDFNNQIESSEFTQKLMKWSSISKAHVTGILHVNPNSDKGRGHFGTILAQKCESVVIIKDVGNHSEVRCKRGRGKKFDTFAVGVNSDWLPYALEDYVSQEQLELISKIKKTASF